MGEAAGARGGGTLGVLIPTLDEEAFLPRALERLLAAPDPLDRPELVVVADGGSRDRTRELALEAGATLVEAPRGRGAQLARGAAELECEILCVLHADTVPAPGAIAALRRAFEDPGVVATGMRQRIDAEGRLFRSIERIADLRVRALGLVYGDSGLAVRRSAYDAAGGFRDVPIFEDVDLSRRLRRLGRVRLVRDAELLVSARRWRARGALRQTLRNWMLTVGYALGVDPEVLARHYAPESAPRGSTATGSSPMDSS